MDARGIDKQVILPSLGYHPYRDAVRNAPELALDTLDTYNRWAAERLHGYTERLIPATVVDLSDVDTEHLRRGIAVMPENPTVFEGTIAENLSWGRPDADPASADRRK